MNNTVLTSKLDEKIQKAQTDLEKARAKEDTDQIISSLRTLGQHYLDGGDAPQALTHFNEALKLVAETGDQVTHAQVLGFRGIALKLIGNFSLALQSFRKSNAVANKAGHASLTCDSYIQIALLRSEMGDITDAISNLSRAMQVATEQKDQPRRMRICGLFGDNFYKLEAFDKAVEYYVLGSEIARGLEKRAVEASFLTKVANIFLLEREIESAIGQYENALKIASTIEDRNAEINILGGLFRAYALDGNVRLARVYGEQVIHLARDFKHVEAEVSNIIAVASFLFENGKASDAISFLERGLQIADEHHSPDLKSDMLTRLGLAQYQEQEHDLALENFTNALEAARSVKDESTQARVLGYIASLYADLEQYENSIEAALKAISLAENLEDDRLAAEQQILLAFNYRDLNRVEEAIEHCSNALESFKKMDDQDMVERAKMLLEELKTAEA
jgi:tetratricopeptide (TPR) repeat protein